MIRVCAHLQEVEPDGGFVLKVRVLMMDVKAFQDVQLITDHITQES